MTRLNEIPLGESISLCLYGGAGTGKTWICGTAGDRTLYCDVEGRLATLQGKDFKLKYNFNPIVIKVTEEPIPEGGAKALIQISKEINKAVLTYPDEFDTIIIDGATALRRFAMNFGLEINLKGGKSKTLAKDNPVRAITDGFPYANISVNDYQTEMNLIEKFLVTMKETCEEYKKNWVMTAHERINYKKRVNVGDAQEVDKIYPGFTGQTFPDTIPGFFDLVWHTRIKGGHYIAETEGDSITQAKTCYNGIFPKQIENVNLTEVFKKIRNG